MNIEQVKEFLEANKENHDVLGLVKQYAPNQEFGFEQARQLIETNEEAKRWLDSEKDKHFTKSLETFKTKTMPTLIDEEIKKRNPDKSPEQIELEKLRADFENAQRQLQLKGVKEKAISIATEKKIPLDILDFFINEDEEKTKENLSVFETTMQHYVKSQVDNRLSGSYTPPAGDGKVTTLTRDSIKNMSTEELMKIQQTNPQLLNDALKN